MSLLLLFAGSSSGGGGGGGTAALSANALIATRASVGPTAKTSLAAKADLTLTLKAGPTAVAPLTGKLTSAQSSKDSPTVTASLAGKSKLTLQASASVKATASLGGRLASMLAGKGGGSYAARLGGVIAAQARAKGGIAGIVALAATAAIKLFGKVGSPGAIALAARALIATFARATPRGTAGLQAKGVLTLTGAAGVSGKTSLSGRLTMQSGARAAASAAARLAAIGKTMARSRGAITARASLAATGTIASGAKAVIAGAVSLGGRATIRLFMPGVLNTGQFAHLTATMRIGLRAGGRIVARFVKTALPPSQRSIRIAAAINRAFGETFTLTPMIGVGDVNLPAVADASRVSFDTTGKWEAATKSRLPHGRGSVQDDTAQSSAVSAPSVSFAVADLTWTPMWGDLIRRRADASAWRVSTVLPDGEGRIVLKLSSVARSARTPLAPSDRTARLSASLNRVFEEMFTFTPMIGVSDANLPSVADNSRAAFDAMAIWEGASKSRLPPARGSVQDDNAQSLAISAPSLSAAVFALTWTPARGDAVRRKADNSVWRVSSVMPDGMGRVLIKLSTMKRSA